ncbi:MAG: HTTM domain-containing protein, partial [Planctomycetaceae bacterium]|nr:HTTM domain-containing protein [Planctomycetaceae bacterium]
MGRLLNVVRPYLRGQWEAGWAAWDRFWFAPMLPWALGILRLISGLMLLYTHVVWGFALEEFFGPNGWQDPLLVQTHHNGSTAWSFWWLAPDAWLWTVHGLCLAVLAAYAVGLWTRVTSILALTIAISYAHRAPLANFGLDQINILTCLYLCFAPSGAVFSVDRLIVRFRESNAALKKGEKPQFSSPVPTAGTRLATRLLQVHMAILYLFAGLSKLKGDSWWDGNAIWLAAANYEYQSNSLVWLCWHPWIVNIATHVTILWETTFIFTVSKPRLRPLVLAVGAAMHLGIGMFLGMWTFGLAMMFTYVSYVPPERIERLQRLLLTWRPVESLPVEYVRTSVWQRGWLALRCALDLRGRLEPTAVEVPEPLPQVQVVTAAPLSPGEWWRQLRRQPPAWVFPAANDGQHHPPRVLIARAYLRPLMELQEYFLMRGFEPR